MTGRTIVITGASDGIGAVAARQLAAQGDHVAVVGRSRDKTNGLAAAIGARAYLADFADLSQVRALATRLQADHERIDVLVNNAGAIMPRFTRTADGIETTIQVNHLAPFLLTNLLLSVLEASRATVINTASSSAKRLAHLDLDDLENERTPDMQKAYGDSKLANILFTRELQRRHGGDGISTVAFHPGNVASNFAADTTSSWRFIYGTPLRHVMLISPERGTRTLLWLVNGTPEQDWQPGQFYIKHHVAASSPQAGDPALARALWDRSAALVGLVPAG